MRNVSVLVCVLGLLLGFILGCGSPEPEKPVVAEPVSVMPIGISNVVMDIVESLHEGIIEGIEEEAPALKGFRLSSDCLAVAMKVTTAEMEKLSPDDIELLMRDNRGEELSVADAMRCTRIAVDIATEAMLAMQPQFEEELRLAMLAINKPQSVRWGI